MAEQDKIFGRVLFGDIYTDVYVEELYQAFKARLMRELVAREQITHDAFVEYPLEDASLVLRYDEATTTVEADATAGRG